MTKPKWSLAEQEAWQRVCYGQTEWRINEDVKEWIRSPVSLGKGDPKWFVFSLISDAQECICHGDEESARKLLNYCKFVLDKHVETDWENDPRNYFSKWAAQAQRGAR
jgi:hypothetical protein